MLDPTISQRWPSTTDSRHSSGLATALSRLLFLCVISTQSMIPYKVTTLTTVSVRRRGEEEEEDYKEKRTRKLRLGIGGLAISAREPFDSCLSTTPAPALSAQYRYHCSLEGTRTPSCLYTQRPISTSQHRASGQCVSQKITVFQTPFQSLFMMIPTNGYDLLRGCRPVENNSMAIF